MARDAANLGVECDVDPLVDEQLLKRAADVRVFVAGKLRAFLEHAHLRAESTKCLSQFEADVAAAEHHQMLGQAVELERLDMSHRFGLGQSGQVRNRGARTKVEEHPL